MQLIRRRKRRQSNSDDFRGILDLTSLGSPSQETIKRKMVPPGVSNRFNYSYEDQIETNATADLQLLGDTADHDIEYATNVYNAKHDLPSDPENRGDLSAERSLAHGLDIRDGGQGIQSGAVEETWYPGSGLRITKRLT